MGLLGAGSNVDYDVPTQIGTDTDWATVNTYSDHTCGVKTNGSLYCWGSNKSKQLGTGSNADYLDVPTQVGSDTDWANVNTGQLHTCSIKTNGSIYCWGSNSFGQLGRDFNTQQTVYDTPVQVESDTDWINIAVGAYHTCGLKTDGSLYCWGSNRQVQCGVGIGIDWIYEPTRVNQ